MDMEEIENQIEPRKLLHDALGFVNVEHYHEFKDHATLGLIRFGNVFHRALGQCLELANTKDAIKIINVWQQECEQHAQLYKIYLAKTKAEAGDAGQ